MCKTYIKLFKQSIFIILFRQTPGNKGNQNKGVVKLIILLHMYYTKNKFKIYCIL